jgi:tape measure domain-containing protein
MSPTVDDRIVSLKFDSAQFEQKVSQIMTALDQLNQKLRLQEGLQGFNNITAAANAVNLNNVANSVDKVASRFDALGAIGFSVIQKLTQNLMGAVGQFAQQDILGPLITGGKTRAQNIEQAQFQFRGLGMDVNQVMSDAKNAVLGTAYGLGDAAKAAAQFGASGITAGEQMSTSLRAIAGVAAMTNSSFSDIAYLFTTSAAMGRITTMDLQQFATRGMNAAAAFAKVTGQTEAQVYQLASSGKLSYQEFATAMDQAFGKHAQDANQTYAGSLSNLHAAMSRLGASLFGPEMTQQRDLYNSLIPVIDNLSAAMQPLIKAFLDARGAISTGLIDTFKNLNTSSWTFIFQSLGNSLTNVFGFLKQVADIAKSAWDAIFPTSLGITILLIVQGIERFTASLKMGAETADKLKSVFQGFFAVLDIAWAVLKGIASVFVDVVKAIFPAAGGFLNVAASVGDFLTKLDEMLVKSGAIQSFFDRLGQILSKPAAWIGELVSKITSFFSTKPDDSGISNAFDNISKHIQSIGDFWQSFYDRFQKVFDVFGKVWDYISNWFSELWGKIADAIGGGDYNAVADVLNVGILGAIAVMLKNFTTGGFKIGLGGGVFGIIQSNLIAVTRTLNQMQAKIQADTIFKIAAAIGILAISLTVLAGIDSEKLTKALGAVAVGMGELVATMKILQASTKSLTGMVSIAVIAGSMIAVAIAMGVLSMAIKNLSDIPWEGLAKGLTGVGVGLGFLVAAAKLLQGSSAGMISAGLGMIAMSVGLLILSQAVEAFSKLSWEAMAKGLAGVAVGLGLLTAAMRFMPASSVISGAGFVEMTIGLRILADVVQEFGKLSWESIGKGLLGIAGGLLAVTAAVQFMPVTLPITAAGFVVLSVGLRIMADAIAKIGSIDMGGIGKALLGLAGAMLILVPAMNLMQGSVGGALAMAIVSAGLVMLADVMVKLAGLGITQIVTSLGAIAAVLVLLGLAAAALQPVIPAMLELGIALGIIGGAFALFGLGAFMVAEAFQVMAVAGVAGTAALLQSIKMLLKAIPEFAAAVALFLVAFAQNILAGLPTFIKVFQAVLEQILLTVIKEVPLIAAALASIIDAACVLLITKAPELIATAFFLLMTFLQGVRDNIYQIVTVGAEIIINFLAGLTSKIPDLVTAAVNLIVTFINSVAEHMTEIMAAGTNLLVQFLLGISNNISQVVTAVGQIVITFITELGNQAGNIVTAGVNVIIKFIEGLAQNAIALANAAGKTILDFLTGLDQAIKTYEPQIISKALQIGVDIIAGIFQGVLNAPALKDLSNWIHDLGSKVISWVGDIAGWVGKIGENIIHGIWNGIVGMGDWLKTKIYDWVRQHIPGWMQWALGMNSPSKVMADMVGKNIPSGIMMGITANSKVLLDGISNLSNNIVSALQPDPKDLTFNFANAVSQLSDLGEFNPVITPVLDLSKVEEASKGIADYMKVATITPDVSTKTAAIISTTVPTGSTDTSSSTSTGPTEVNFNQTINSPTALSTNDIYLNTKNQLTMAKKELGIE